MWRDLPPKAAVETFNEMIFQSKKDSIAKKHSLTGPGTNN